MHGYDTYDYGARGYYAAIGRFQTMDPHAEKYYSVSPYAYCKGNPVNAIDPNGMDATDPKPATDQTTAIDNTANKVPQKIEPIQAPQNLDLKEAQKAEANKPKNQLVQGPSNLEKAIVLTPEEKALVPVVQTAMAVITIAPVATAIGEVTTSAATINMILRTAPITLPAGEGFIKALINAPPDAPSLFQNQVVSDFVNGGTTLILDNKTPKKK